MRLAFYVHQLKRVVLEYATVNATDVPTLANPKQHSQRFVIVPRLSSDQVGMLDLRIAIITGTAQMLGVITNLNTLFSTDFKIRFKKFGIAIDPKGRSSLSYRRRSDGLPQTIQVTQLVNRNLIFQNKKHN